MDDARLEQLARNELLNQEPSPHPDLVADQDAVEQWRAWLKDNFRSMQEEIISLKPSRDKRDRRRIKELRAAQIVVQKRLTFLNLSYSARDRQTLHSAIVDHFMAAVDNCIEPEDHDQELWATVGLHLDLDKENCQ